MWEYHLETFSLTEKWAAKSQEAEYQKLRDRLNQLGGEGWELITFDQVQLVGAFTKNVKGYIYFGMFKRAR